MQHNEITLILIHGSLSTPESWRVQCEFFSSQQLQVIAYTVPVPTADPSAAEQPHFTVAHSATEVARLVSQYRHTDIYLLGHSRGGDIALLAATLCPKDLRGVILADPAPLQSLLPDTVAVQDLLTRRREVVDQAVRLIRTGRSEEGLTLFTDAMSISGKWDALPEHVKCLRRQARWSLASLNADSLSPVPAATVRALNFPVLLLTGEESPPIYGAMHDALRSLLANSQFSVIPEASHGMHLDNPPYFNDTVLRFIMGTRHTP